MKLTLRTFWKIFLDVLGERFGIAFDPRQVRWGGGGGVFEASLYFAVRNQ